jgi:hypothetical protein
MCRQHPTTSHGAHTRSLETASVHYCSCWQPVHDVLTIPNIHRVPTTERHQQRTSCIETAEYHRNLGIIEQKVMMKSADRRGKSGCNTLAADNLGTSSKNQQHQHQGRSVQVSKSRADCRPWRCASTASAPSCGEGNHHDVRDLRDTDALLSSCKRELSETMSVQRLACLYQHLKILSKNRNTAHAYRSGEGVLRLLEPKAMSHMRDFTPRHINMLLGAYASLSIKMPHSLHEEVSNRIAACVDDFDERDIANCLWGFAKAKQHPAKHALCALFERGDLLVEKFNPQNVSNVLWAYATLVTPPLKEGAEREFVRRLCIRAGRVVGNFKPQGSCCCCLCVVCLCVCVCVCVHVRARARVYVSE